MSDLTVIYYTANVIPGNWEQFVTQTLLSSIGDAPLVSVSQKPMPGFGRNIYLENFGRSHLNIYRQMLIGAKAAETKYLAFTEDDILYPPDHFTYRPSKDDIAAYDMHKWALYTWMQPPCFNTSSYRRTTGCIVARELFIEAMEERFARWPGDSAPLSHFCELGRHEAALGVTVRETEEFFSKNPHVVVFHEQALGWNHLGKRKRPGVERTEAIPYWGKAEDLARVYYAD